MLRIVDLDADGAMRADHRALAALNAAGGVPHRDVDRQVALLVLGRADREGAVARKRRDREVVAASAKTGRLLWRSGKLIGGSVYAAPTVVDGHLFAAAWSRRLYRFDTAKLVSRRR